MACSCRLPSADQILERSASIFTGVALKTRPAAGREAITTFRVIAGYKRVKRGQVVSIRHRSGPSASCGIRFEQGQRHLVATGREGMSETAGACSIAAMRSEAGEELVRRLGR